MSGIQILNSSKLAINWKNDNDVTIFWHEVNIKLFWRCLVCLVKFSCWPKFHVNLITGSGVVAIFFYKGLTRNPEIGKPPSNFCPISGDWNKLGILNLARMSLIKFYWMLLNASAAACTVSELLRENQQRGGGGKIALSPSQIRVKNTNAY